MREPLRILRPLLLVAVAVSIVHYVDNTVNYADYPQPTGGFAPSRALVGTSGLGEVVVAVQALRLPPPSEEREDLRHGPVHHRLTVGEGVVLGPLHVRDVRLELARALEEVREVGVLEWRLRGRRQLAGLGDVGLRQLVADAA